MQIYMVVHGQCVEAEKGIRSSKNDTLTEKGLKQAKKTIDSLKGSRKFSAIYTSDLDRTLQIAEMAKEAMGIPVIKTAALRDIDYGDYTGKSREATKENVRRNKEDVMDFLKRFPNGESFYDVQKRVISFISNLNANNLNEEYLFVTHTGVIRAINDFYGHHSIYNAQQRAIRPEYIGIMRVEQFNQSASYDEQGNYEDN